MFHLAEVDEEHSGYTSRLGMAHRRGDDLRDILHDFSREPYFPSKVQQVRIFICLSTVLLCDVFMCLLCVCVYREELQKKV